MNKELQNILSLIRENEALTTEEKQSVEGWIKNIDDSITIDAIKLEWHAREGQIESALERIRSRTIRMQKSDELLQTSQVLFDQFNQLGYRADQFTIGIMNETGGVVEIYATVNGQQLPKIFRHPISEPYVMNKVYSAWKAGESSLVFELGASELKAYNQFRNELVGKEMFATDIPAHQKRVLTAFYFSNGMIAFGDSEQPPPETMTILRRFANVFEQTYTRFSDLQKAEAHALQAEQDLVEIEAARQRAEEALRKLQATQAQLIHAEKMASLGELTAGIAHEIQNPLNFVNNFSAVSVDLLNEMKEELRNGNLPGAMEIDDHLQQNLQKITEHGKRAASIVKGMLQHSRKSTGKKELTDMNALVDEYVRLSYHGLRAKDKSFHATIETKYDEAIRNVEIIPGDIGRVLLNLLNNAFYSVNEKKNKLIGLFEPVVCVFTEKVNHKVLITVKDNGTGIDEKVLGKIYQPFFTTKPTGEGTGLGLSLSYDIITKGHGGEMTVETEEGIGATFIISLPLI